MLGDEQVRRHQAPTQESPRYTGLASFFRAPYIDDPAHWSRLQVGIAGVPYDGGTTNRPGARHGPRAVREVSTMIAPWNPALDIRPFDLCAIADIGDAWVREPFNLESSLSEIQAFYDQVVASGVTPLSVGGDHAVSLPILRAVAASSPVAMVHIDAHCDTGDGFMGSRFHHGAPFSRAVEEGLLIPEKVVQIGIRGPLNGDVWRFSREHGMRVITIDEFIERGVADVMDEAHRIVGATPCYISFDVDALDPAFAPGTGTPVVGGLSTREALAMVRRLRGLDIVGGDLVEVSPPFDVAQLTALAGATILFEVLCVLAESVARRPSREV